MNIHGSSVPVNVHDFLGQALGKAIPYGVSTTVDIEGHAFSAKCPPGDFIRVGIREHAMAAILNGIVLHGSWRPYGSTYPVFSDYLRPALRLAALMKLPTIMVFTHGRRRRTNSPTG
jgi:transketolase